MRRSRQSLKHNVVGVAEGFKLFPVVEDEVNGIFVRCPVVIDGFKRLCNDGTDARMVRPVVINAVVAVVGSGFSKVLVSGFHGLFLLCGESHV